MPSLNIYVNCVPEDWGSFSAVRCSNVIELRQTIDNVFKIEQSIRFGIDVVNIFPIYTQCLLKLAEDSNLDLVLLMAEPVLPTLLSRAVGFYKKPLSKIESFYNLFIFGESGISQKIRELV